MINGLYSAGSALDVATVNQDLAAENLAQATTPGFRRQGFTLEALQRAVAGEAPANLGGVRSAGAYTSFNPGPFQQTGAPLDLALSGDAFFVLEGPSGPLYTRNGVFELNAQGDLQSKNGLRVRGQGSRITIPQNAASIRIGPDGSVFADGTEVGRLQLAQFANPSELQRAGTTVFSGPAPRQPEPGTVRVEQGYREGSNVQVVNEMVSMMIGMRQYEAAERALKALSDSVALNTRPQG